MGIWYTSREQVKQAMDFKETARSDGQVDGAIEAASRDVEALCHRIFYPVQATRYFDWPGHQYARPWRLWLDQDEAIAVDSITTGGAPLADGDWLLEPANDGPPYNRIEINLAADAAFSSGDTFQQAIAVTGLFGFADTTTTSGVLVGAVTAVDDTVTVDGPAAATVGVGSLLRLDDERLTVTGRRQVDTGQTLADAMANQNNDVTLTVADATGFAAGETVLVDGERMYVIDVTGTALVVKRAWDGSTLAAHTAGTTVYAPRRLAVRRGVLGTTAAAHDAAAPVLTWEPPGPVRELTEALALNTVLQQQSGYARQVGSGEGQREASGRGIANLRDRVYHSHGRMARVRAV